MLDKLTNDTDNLTNERTNERTIRKVHCFFEQSGTFKNEFRKLGYEAYDYDILNDYGQTDFQIDLFTEIEKAYDGEKSVFDDISQDDLIMAFFPCTKFEDQAILGFRGDRYQMKNYTIQQKLEYCLEQHEQLHRNYDSITKLVIICINQRIKLIIENPYSEQHYLTRYWCVKPNIIDKDRTRNGDIYRKPTQFWFVGTEPKRNLVFEPIEYVETVKALQRVVGKNGKKREVLRSEIHPQYANRFIRQYIIDE